MKYGKTQFSQVVFDFNVSDLFDNGVKLFIWFIECTMWVYADFHVLEVWMTPLESGFILLIVNWWASVFLLYWLEDFNFSGSAHFDGFLLGSYDIFVFFNGLFWLTRRNLGFLFFVYGLKPSDLASDMAFVLKVGC